MSIELYRHGRRTAWLTDRLCAVLDVPRHVSRDWAIAALTHDIGELDTPAGLLEKPRALTWEERCIVERHCIAGTTRLLARAKPDEEDSTTSAVAVALSHHERWDGTGYPFGLHGNAIPMCARVVAVADVVDALTSARPYRAAWSLEAALEEVTARRGSQFDPDCADAMRVVARRMSPEWRAIAEGWGLQLTLESGRGARVLLNLN